MKGKKINSQVIDLQNESCPMNLVKFKYHFYELKTFVCFAKKGEATDGILAFLHYKGTHFEVECDGEKCMISVFSH